MDRLLMRMRSFASEEAPRSGPVLAPPVAKGALMLYWLSLFVACAPAMRRYFGWLGLIGYAIALSAFLPWLLRVRPQALLSRRALLGLLVAAVVVLAVMFVVVFPIADRGLKGGSDSDNALDAGAAALSALQYPYYAQTYLKNPLASLPGAFMLAYPFWSTTGRAAYQNIFHLIIFVGIVLWLTRSVGLTLWNLVLTFALSLSFIHCFLTGSDRFTNSVVVLSGIVAVVHNCRRSRTALWLLSCAYLGVGLSWRSPFFLAMPVLFGALVRRSGWRWALASMCVVGVTFVAVTAPFYLYDPPAFFPLQLDMKLTIYDRTLPFGSTIVKAASISAALLLMLLPSNRDDVGFFRNLALGQMVLVFGSGSLQTLAKAIGSGRTNIDHFAYAPFFMFFAVLSALLSIARQRCAAEIDPAPRPLGAPL